MKKIATILLTVALVFVLLSGCGDSSSSPSAGDSSLSSSGGEGDVTWTWGNFRGLYGDAEVAFNEDGGRDTVLLKYSNGALYRQIQYSYEMEVGAGNVILSGRAVYPVEKITLDAAGNQLYIYRYSWSPCERSPEQWGASIASDITPILEAGEGYAAGETPEAPEERYYSSSEWGYDCEKEESSGSTQYQELSHLMVGGQNYQATYEYGGGYWLTKRVGGSPAKTWFYAADGRLDEDLTITWHYDDDKPVDMQKGQYSMYTYGADISDGGQTVTYVLDESHTNEDDDGDEKALTQVYTLTLSWQDDGKPAVYKYNYYKEFLNTDDPADEEYSITYQYDNGMLSGAAYQTPKNTYTITCNDRGMLETVDHLRSSLGSGDIGAKAYTYFDSGALESVTYYHDFTAGDPERIHHIEKFYENGGRSGLVRYDYGVIDDELTYFEDGREAGRTIYTDDGEVSLKYTRAENGVYNFYERYNDEGVLRQSGEQTAENEFTIYLHEGDSKRAIEAYICHEDGYDLVYYSDDGSISSQKTYGYDEIHYR
ncbi:hypothetical protein [uncultured Acetatifactor sp.]|uniref:hypothetical protein n=1 Tax=uncultured Acetatifactor sp. TaxID=1671927 RepID=UPI00262FF0DA|nr:hypothetical protein [uncultured Acetatifactor sp.]